MYYTACAQYKSSISRWLVVSLYPLSAQEVEDWHREFDKCSKVVCSSGDWSHPSLWLYFYARMMFVDSFQKSSMASTGQITSESPFLTCDFSVEHLKAIRYVHMDIDKVTVDELKIWGDMQVYLNMIVVLGSAPKQPVWCCLNEVVLADWLKLNSGAGQLWWESNASHRTSESSGIIIYNKSV